MTYTLKNKTDQRMFAKANFVNIEVSRVTVKIPSVFVLQHRLLRQMKAGIIKSLSLPHLGLGATKD